jgi:hypothetical protein
MQKKLEPDKVVYLFTKSVVVFEPVNSDIRIKEIIL